MPPHIRATIAASAYAFVTGQKVAGLYDHAAKRHSRIAAEARGQSLMGYDGDRGVKFGGTLPELVEAKRDTQIHMAVNGSTAQGFDRASASHFTVNVAEHLVQLYDHKAAAWFAFDVQVA